MGKLLKEHRESVRARGELLTLGARADEIVVRHKNVLIKNDDEILGNVIAGSIQKLGRNHIHRRGQFQVAWRVELQNVGVSLLIANLKSRHDAVHLAFRDLPGSGVRSVARSNWTLTDLVRQ